MLLLGKRGIVIIMSVVVCLLTFSLTQQLCHFSYDFDKIFKIALLYIKYEAYSFLSWLGGFRGNSVCSLVFSSLAQCLPFSSDFDTIVKIAVLYIIDEVYSFL